MERILLRTGYPSKLFVVDKINDKVEKKKIGYSFVSSICWTV